MTPRNLSVKQKYTDGHREQMGDYQGELAGGDMEKVVGVSFYRESGHTTRSLCIPQITIISIP